MTTASETPATVADEREGESVDADELRAWMTEHGRTVRGLAHELDIGRATVMRWRAGESPIPKTAELALQVLARRRPPPPGTGN